MPQVVRIIHKDIVRRCRIPDSWEIPPIDPSQRLLCINARAVCDAFAHAAGEMQHEIGGYITGYPAYDDVRGISFVYVDKVVRGIYESSPTHVTMFAQGYVAADAVCRADNTYVVGWYHSHPRLTVFFSGTDHNNHRSNFSRPHEIGMVVDPAQGSVPIDCDSATISTVLNQRNFAVFIWNRTVDAVIRATTNIVYVDSAPIDETADAENTETKLSDESVDGETSNTQIAPVINEVHSTDPQTTIQAPNLTVPTVVWDESVYAQMLCFLSATKGTRIALYGMTRGTTSIRLAWQTRDPVAHLPRDSRLVGLVLMADDDLTASLLNCETTLQICDLLKEFIVSESTSVMFPLHIYLASAQQYVHTVALVADDAKCVWHEGEPFEATQTGEISHD